MRFSTMEMTNADMGICDLPSEMVLTIAGMCRGCDVEALGATCHSMRAIARDPRLWRHLFERDFGAMYPVRAQDISWVRHVRTHGPWVDAVCRSWGIAVPPPLLRAPSSKWSWVPGPLACMRSAGKDARWLHKVHAMAATECGDAPSVVFVGDTAAGKPHGYGTHFHHRPKQTAAWGEGMQADGQRVAWCVSADGSEGHTDLVTIHGDFCGTMGKPVCSHVVTRLYTLDDDMLQGIYLELRDAESLPPYEWVRRVFHYVRDSRTRERTNRADGATSEYVFDEGGGRHGLAMTWYGNGDRVDHEWTHGDLTRIVAFTFSSTCADLEFAGRAVDHNEWARDFIRIGTEHEEWVFWPVGDSEGARLFWRYVVSGLIGWHPRLRDEALLHMEPI